MKINLAQSAGFCSGVKRAVRLALQSAARYPGRVFMLGDIVHNEIVVQRLKQAGIKTVSSISQVPRGAVMLIRAHGSAPETYRRARLRKLKIIDATCPMVAEIHRDAICLEKQEFAVAIIGEAGHDEVLGIAGEIQKPVILTSADDARRWSIKNKKIGVVVQSTQNIDLVKDIVSILLDRAAEVRVFNTICASARTHQAEIRRLPRQNDAMVIIGSKKSGNTKRLFEISRALNSRTYWVETARDLKSAWFRRAKTVGVTAGASAPPEVIMAVVEKLKDY